MITLRYNIHFAASSGSSCPSHLVPCVINVPRRPLARGHLASWFHLEGELLSSVFRSPKSCISSLLKFYQQLVAGQATIDPKSCHGKILENMSQPFVNEIFGSPSRTSTQEM